MYLWKVRGAYSLLGVAPYTYGLQRDKSINFLHTCTDASKCPLRIKLVPAPRKFQFNVLILNPFTTQEMDWPSRSLFLPPGYRRVGRNFSEGKNFESVDKIVLEKFMRVNFGGTRKYISLNIISEWADKGIAMLRFR